MTARHLVLADGRIDLADGVHIRVGATDPGIVALELALLLHGLADTLSITSATAKVKLRFDRGAVALRIETSDSRQLTVAVGPQPLAAWHAYFLRYWRDGAPDVNHIDTDLGDAYLTWSAP